jgi:hypothetical protein
MKNVKILKIKTGEYGERPLSKVRLFIETKGEGILDNLVNRHSRPFNIYRKLVLPPVLEKLKLAGTKVSWNQKAGCSCGCSPGYILDIHPVKTGFEAIWVTIK